ncbi:hypothetical protein BP6252_09032 [Coleophoma cylindrospora]|uniref:Glucanase n=1 Tax=Coleophoma cylindrospora TaxID=1849047 RepID=A0A3D8R0S6_9HELO|nr:hypothetical protein BP6252_09032 [Coleophoma cylindrospora]
MHYTLALASSGLLALASAQSVGKFNFTREAHPSLSTQRCTLSGGCTALQTSLVLEADQRALRSVANPDVLCYDSTGWNTALCPDPTTCAKNCAPDGVDYSKILSTNGSSITMKLKDGSPRVYLLSEDENKYQMFYLKGQEFTYDVNVADLPCGTNGALYFINMDEDGGMTPNSTNKAGPAYGTGYCDAQCPTYIRWIDGQANINSTRGSCCPEMDIWEANKIATAYTPHPCSTDDKYTCDSNIANDCGICDKGGCDWNSYKNGNTSFYGPNMTVDTNRPFTVVTQFLTSDNTTNGTLSEIRRLYIQDGVVIENSRVNIPGFKEYDSLSADYCVDEKRVFNATDDFTALGGFDGFSKSLDVGMVLSMSIWDDAGSYMLWLDGVFPVNAANSSAPGVARGTCGVDESIPANLEGVYDPAVTFSNIKFGDIGSTF